MYDNELGCHVEEPEVMQGQWFVDPATGILYIAAASSNLENVGPDDAIMDRINQLCRADIDTMPERFADALHREFGLEPVAECLKRFTPEEGYYHA